MLSIILYGGFIGWISGICINEYCVIDCKNLWLKTIVIGALYSLAIYKANYSFLTMLYLINISAALIVGATIDSQIFILPNEGAILLIIQRLIFVLANGCLFWEEKCHLLICQIFIALLWGVIFYAIRLLSNKSLGLGDVKWIIAIIFILPWEQSYEFVVNAFVLGSFYILALKLKDLIKGNDFSKVYIPFGPFLTLSALALLWNY